MIKLYHNLLDILKIYVRIENTLQRVIYMKNKYKWNKKEIFKTYLENIREIYGYGNIIERLYDKDYLEDMIHETLKLPYYYPKILRHLNFKNDMNEDYNFVNEVLTPFQKEKIEIIIKNALEYNFNYSLKYNPYKENTDYIKLTKEYLKNISLTLYDELNNVIDNNRLYIDKHKDSDNIAFAGSCYSLEDKNFYKINQTCYDNLFITLNHENVHGTFNKISNRKFDKNKKLALYREVGSILIELYGSCYLYENGYIDDSQYSFLHDSVYLTNIYNDAELTDLLYKMANVSFDKNIKTMKKVINSEIQINPNYDFKINELNELPLSYYLIYLYSAAIAICIFEKYKDNPKEGMKVAIDIMLNVNEENEKELFELYDINLEKYLNAYKLKNNSSVKRRTN